MSDHTMRAEPPTAAEVRAVAALDGSHRPQVLCRHYDHGTSWCASGNISENAKDMAVACSEGTIRRRATRDRASRGDDGGFWLPDGVALQPASAAGR